MKNIHRTGISKIKNMEKLEKKFNKVPKRRFRSFKSLPESNESIRLREQCKELGIDNIIWDNNDIVHMQKIYNKSKR